MEVKVDTPLWSDAAPGSEPGEVPMGTPEAESRHCLSCNACRPGCAIHSSTSRLQPLKLVRMLNLGLLDELLHLPEIWYCLQCNQCSSICPMTVQPSTLIKDLRKAALSRLAVDLETVEAYEALCADLVRARWHLIAGLKDDREIVELPDNWRAWARRPIPPVTEPLSLVPPTTPYRALETATQNAPVFSSDLSGCLTCRECSATCPIAFEQEIFDPATLFRLVSLGATETLLASPSIWLCLECQSCSEVCGQNVNGHLLLQNLQALAMREGFVRPDMRHRLSQINSRLYPLFLQEVDTLFGLPAAESSP